MSANPHPDQLPRRAALLCSCGIVALELKVAESGVPGRRFVDIATCSRCGRRWAFSLEADGRLLSTPYEDDLDAAARRLSAQYAAARAAALFPASPDRARAYVRMAQERTAARRSRRWLRCLPLGALARATLALHRLRLLPERAVTAIDELILRLHDVSPEWRAFAARAFEDSR